LPPLYALRQALASPSAVFGPVERSQGRHFAIVPVDLPAARASSVRHALHPIVRPPPPARRRDFEVRAARVVKDRYGSLLAFAVLDCRSVSAMTVTLAPPDGRRAESYRRPSMDTIEHA